MPRFLTIRNEKKSPKKFQEIAFMALERLFYLQSFNRNARSCSGTNLSGFVLLQSFLNGQKMHYNLYYVRNKLPVSLTKTAN